jgi:hypothetical protein
MMKTIAQAAGEYAADESRTTRSEHAAFVDGAAFAQRWIPVEEELPENSDNEQSLLVKQDNGRVAICYYYRNNWFWSPSFCKVSNVTHWRPTELK